MRKIFTFILALIVGVGTIFAESGTCGADGDNLTWDLTDGVLTISGTGAMKDFSSEDPSWAPYISSIQSVVIEEGVENIGMYAFWQCSALTAVTIPKSVWSIGQCAFNACYVLSSITIPSNVSFIGARTFYGCTGLTSITCKAKEPPYCSSDCFGFVNNSIPVYVPQGTKAAYKDANEWKEFNNILDELPCEPIVGTCGADGDNLTWALTCDGVLTISGTGDMADWNTDYPAWSPYISTIKSIVIEEGIISIGAWAFYNCSNLTTVTIPNSVTIIGTGAFYNCSNLTTVTIPNSVVYIVDAAFAGCSALSTITIPNSVLYIGDIAFQSCTGLTSITCKATTPPSCGSDCFKNVDTSIPLYVPQGTKAAYKDADEWKEFNNILDELPCEPIVGTCGADGDNLTWELSCDGVLTISGTGAMADYESSSDVPWIDYLLEIKSLVIEEGVTSIGKSAFYDCRALTSIAISNSVTSIGMEAFGMCISLTSVTIPNSVKSIGDGAFIVCENLTSVKIGNGVTSIGEMAFQQCTNLSSVTMGNSIKTIGTSAFADCSALTSIVIPNSVTSIGESVFYGCSSLTSIVIPSNVTSIGYAAFSGCSGLTSLTIGKSVTRIGMYAFKNCSGLTEITCKAMTPPECSPCFDNVNKTIPLYVPAGTKEAYKGADEWKDFTNIQEELPCEPIVGTCGAEGDNLTWTLTCVGELIISGTGAMTNWDDAFTIPWYSNRMSIQSVVINDGVTSIGEMAFINCTALNAVTIGSGVTSIGSGAFAYCSGLTEITCKAMTPPTCAASECFLDVDKTIPVYAPTKALTDYQNAYVWKEFTNIQSDECLLGFGTCGAEGDNLTWALSCEGVLTISGTGAMADYSNTNPWYDNRSSIKSVVIEAGATSIGKYAFYNCDNLTSVTIPGSVKSIGNYAFNKCSSLASVTIPEGVISIGPRAFQNCTSLTSIALPEGITSIGIRTFYQCTSLKSVTIPAGVTNIYDEAFSGCNALTSITCKATTPPTCASNSFYAVTKSIPVYVPAGTKEAYQVAYVWRDFTNIQEPFDPTGFIAYELVDLSTETITAGQYIIVFDDKKAHAEVSGKDLIASSDELTIENDIAYVPEETVCAVTIAPFKTDSFSILLADGKTYMDLQAKNSVTTSEAASGFAITDGGDKQVQIAKYLASESKTYVLKQNSNYFRMYSSTNYILPKLYRKVAPVTYHIRFLNDDGTVLQESDIESGATPVYEGATPVKDATAQYTYTFTGWDKPIVAASEDIDYTAVFESTLRSYTVTFKDEDGTTLDSRLWDYGTTPSCTEPSKPSTAQYTYTFKGWTPDVVAVSKDATYTAVYDAALRSYTVTWINGDGTTLVEESYIYGATPIYKGSEPTRPATEQYTYTFNGYWSPSVAPVTGDATYEAQFWATVRNYTVTWKMDDGSVIDETSWPYGEKPSHADPEKPATAQYEYTFKGWTPEVVEVIKDATYTAVFEEKLRSYTVTWVNWDGTELDKETYNYGTTPVYKGSEPTRPATAENTFTFSGWSPAIAAVTGDITYKAQFNSTGQTYTVTWKMDDGSVLATETYAYGDLPNYTDPVKPATAQYEYTFKGWTPEVTAVSGDATYTAVFEQTLRSYTVTWVNWDGTELDKETYNYGTTPIYKGSEPTRPATAQYEYTFKGWTPEVAAVSKDATYTAVFEQTLRSYTITFVVGPVNYPVTVEYGTPMNALMAGLWAEAQAEYGFTQDIEGNYQYSDGINIYTFTGWDKEIPETVTGEAAYTATYTITPLQPTAVEEMSIVNCQLSTKFIHDGQIFILRGDKIYTITGQIVK